jgi:hypothetical protein
MGGFRVKLKRAGAQWENKEKVVKLAPLIGVVSDLNGCNPGVKL